ncbi:sigma-70 family RNA polymerase sigma factor [Lichenibacterium minor]|uniref:sigma-70 family RNA polymerase sigma factor n=1 Tax=Lichenibacterium minor TaxID=2316528 RepID=UPI001FDFC468|nr:sigma-70 family RNA polymerase sigma factor [Lichenibacterium minor]
MPQRSRERRCPPAASDPAREVAALVDADLLRLGALARLRARGLPGLEGADLLNEAVLRLLDGSRPRPPGVPLVAVLAMTMRGVAHDHWRKLRRERPVLVPARDAAAAALHADPSPGVDPERATAAAQALADIDRLFARDVVALQVIAGMGDGLAPAEIRRRYGLSATAYDTARRRMRRALLRRDGDGGTP